jgi:hypothetical protein
MAGSLESFISQASKKGVQLSGAPKKQLTKAIQQGGGNQKITAKEIQQGRGTYSKAGGTDYLATVGRTYGASQLSKDAKNLLAKRGFTEEGGYYTKSGPITSDVIGKATAAGYDPKDIRSYLAGSFLQDQLGSEIGKFMGEGNYQLDPSTGRWSMKPPITVTGGGSIPGAKSVSQGEGIYAGLNPDTMAGSTPFEMQYASMIDPYKIQAKSAERLGRLAQSTDLLGRKMGYGTEYDIAKINRLQNLQQANIQQANYLYNLIPSAF